MYYILLYTYSLCRHDHGEGRSSHRRRSEVVGSRVELPRVLSPRRWKTYGKMEKKKNKTDINCFAAPRADHLVGQQGARGVAARSPRGEVVAEVPSTPHRCARNTHQRYHILVQEGVSSCPLVTST